MNAEARSVLTIPNALSLSRIIIAPVLLALAWHGDRQNFLILLAVSCLTDAVDGYIARHWSHPSVIGTRLDSWGDFANYMTVPPCVWWLWPEIIREEIWYVGISLASYVIPTLIGALRFGRMTSYHTWGAKASAVLAVITVFLMLTDVSRWPFRFCTPFLVLTAIDDAAITFILSRWQPNVPSFVHALRIERRRG